jgi:hypothetical protein
MIVFIYKYTMLTLSVFSYINIVQYEYIFDFGGKGCVHVYMSLVKLGVQYFRSAESAVCAHVSVLAWDRKSLS